MLIRIFAALVFMTSSWANACAFHNINNASLIGTTDVQEVVRGIVKARKKDTFKNKKKPKPFMQFSLENRLNIDFGHRVDFAMLEPISRHYSQIQNAEKSRLVVLDKIPGEEDLLVITELEVLDALATGKLTWQQAKKKKLVTFRGPEDDIVAINKWFDYLFNESV